MTTYCKDCGVIPGSPSQCIVVELGAATHSFVSSADPVVCRWCGATPSSQPTKCTVCKRGFYAHSFVTPPLV